MNKWAVESKFYDDGKTKITVRPAKEDEKSSFQILKKCDFYIDVFNDENEAREFASQEC